MVHAASACCCHAGDAGEQQHAGLTCIAAIWRVGRRVRAPPDEAPRDALPPGQVPQPLHGILRGQCYGCAQEQKFHVPAAVMSLLWHHRDCNGNLRNSLMALGWVPPGAMPALHAAHLMLGTAASHGPWQRFRNNVHAMIHLVHAQIPAAWLMCVSPYTCLTLNLHGHRRLSSHTNGLIPAAACVSMRGKPLLQGHFVFLQFCLSILASNWLSLQEGTALVRFERHAAPL